MSDEHVLHDHGDFHRNESVTEEVDEKILPGNRRRVGDYVLGETLGAGSFGKVKLATNVHTGEKVAIKIVSKDSIANVEDIDRVYRETYILTTLKHNNIIKLFEVYCCTRCLMIV